MTAPGPIPIQPVSIRPEFVQQPHPEVSPAVKLLISALQHRQQLDIQRQDLARQWAQYELHKSIAGPQIEQTKLENKKKENELKDREDDLVARDQALQIYTGNLPRLGDDAGVGEVIAGIKDPKVAAHFFTFVKEGLEIARARPTPFQPVAGRDVFGAFNQQTGTITPTKFPVKPQSEAVRRIPVVTEREKASSAIGAIQANAIVNRMEKTSPDIAARVARKVALRKGIFTGIIHRLSGTSREDADLLTEQAIEQSMAPDELEFYQASKQWLANVIPGIAGKQMTAREYAIQAPAYFSMGGGTPTVTENRRKARITRTRGLITEAGEAFTERYPEVQDMDLSEYGLGTAIRPPKRYRENPY